MHSWCNRQSNCCHLKGVSRSNHFHFHLTQMIKQLPLKGHINREVFQSNHFHFHHTNGQIIKQLPLKGQGSRHINREVSRSNRFHFHLTQMIKWSNSCQGSSHINGGVSQSNHFYFHHTWIHDFTLAWLEIHQQPSKFKAPLIILGKHNQYHHSHTKVPDQLL